MLARPKKKKKKAKTREMLEVRISGGGLFVSCGYTEEVLTYALFLTFNTMIFFVAESKGDEKNAKKSGDKVSKRCYA